MDRVDCGKAEDQCLSVPRPQGQHHGRPTARPTGAKLDHKFGQSSKTKIFHRRSFANPSSKTSLGIALGEQAPGQGALLPLRQLGTASRSFSDKREITQPEGKAIPREKSQSKPLP